MPAAHQGGPDLSAMHSPEAEAYVIAAAILMGDRPQEEQAGLVTELRALVDVTDFEGTRNRACWQGILDLVDAGAPVDTVSLYDHLRQRGLLELAGGGEYLGIVTEACSGNVFHALHHAQTVHRQADLRRIASEAGRAMEAALDPHADPEEVKKQLRRAVKARKPGSRPCPGPSGEDDMVPDLSEEEAPLAGLVRDEDLKVKHTIGNVTLILEYDQRLPEIWWDEFRLQISLTDRETKVTRALRDADLSEWRLAIEARWGISPAETNLGKWTQMVAERRGRNPLVEYLRGLKWDGVERISGWLRTAAGVGVREEKERRTHMEALTRAYARKVLVQAVSRALRPGKKADAMLVLVGKQGKFKSTLVEVLAGSEFYVDSSIDPGEKDTYLIMNRSWFLEFSELSSIKKSDNESVKSFLTRASDTYRPPYGRCSIDAQRHTVFVGTTNETSFLRDSTGSRRFWPVMIWDPINIEWVRENRDQLWAEAVVAFESGETWWLNEDEEETRAAGSRDFEEEDAWAAFVWDSVKGRTQTTVNTVLGDLVERKIGANYDRASSCRVTAILRGMGWQEGGRTQVDGRTQRIWLRPVQDASLAGPGLVAGSASGRADGYPEETPVRQGVVPF